LLDKINLPADLFNKIVDAVNSCLPEEACGLVVGKENQARAVLPITNELHSPTKFRMAPVEQLHAFLWMEEQKLELIAIYHSHPNGPTYPSETDIADFCYPGTAVLICSRSYGEWAIDAFQIDDNKSISIRLESL
jgi:[CysO sulfur-carrier protein]-S-L-cysteine hydrolase